MKRFLKRGIRQGLNCLTLREIGWSHRARGSDDPFSIRLVLQMSQHSRLNQKRPLRYRSPWHRRHKASWSPAAWGGGDCCKWALKSMCHWQRKGIMLEGGWGGAGEELQAHTYSDKHHGAAPLTIKPPEALIEETATLRNRSLSLIL